MDATLLADGRLHVVLRHVDEELAAEQRAAGCPHCSAKLHSARYPRKPRGVPQGSRAEYDQRLSLCCARDGCRKRVTPPSVRFLGPKVYISAVVMLIAALRCGPTPARCRVLQDLVGVSRHTLVRWHRWWTEELIDTPFWRAACGTLMPPMATAALPAALLERFAAHTRDRLLAALRWLSPVTTRSAAVHAT